MTFKKHLPSTRTLRWFFLCLFGIYVVLSCQSLVCLAPDKPVKAKVSYMTPEMLTDGVIDTTAFMNREPFVKSLEQAKVYPVEGSIIGGVLPHHAVAAQIMGDFYKTLSTYERPEVIILLGPNHRALGEKFQSGNYQFNTYNGLVETDYDLVKALYQKKTISPSTLEAFSIEHSLNIHMNYIAYYFKGVKVVPIILNTERNSDDLDEMARTITDVCQGKNYLIISSVDFSHYLTLAQANEKDSLTQQLLLQKDQEKLVTLSNDYVDCPAAIVLLLKMLELKDDPTCQIIDHSNSETISEQTNLAETTSYFSALYIK